MYAFNDKGKLLQTVRITNATNMDWEDAVTDNVGNLYIGDFGNNDQSRTKLTIYVVQNFLKAQNSTSLEAQKIEFTYGDRSNFPNDVAHSFSMQRRCWFVPIQSIFSLKIFLLNLILA